MDIIKIEQLVKEYYGVEARAYPLVSYEDLNFKIEANSSNYVLKLNQAKASDLEFENALMLYLQEAFSEIIPKLIKAKNGLCINSVSLNGQNYLMRMISFCQGSSLAKLTNPNSELLNSFATSLAKIDQALNCFSHKNEQRYIAWDAKHSLKNIRANKNYLSKKELAIVDYYLSEVLDKLEIIFPKLRQSIIHNDANDYNVLVNIEQTKITAIIDFGDSVKTYLINELAVACSYLMLVNQKPFQLAAEFIANYHKIYPLEEIEIDNLYSFIILRFCLSVTMSAKAKKNKPNNIYASISKKDIWQFLEKYQNLDKDIANAYLREKIDD